MDTTQTGGCRCGAIRVSASGAPRGSFACYCTDCLKLGGGNPTLAATYPVDQVQITQGMPQGYEVTADSGATVTRTFCPTCGTPLTAQSSAHASVIFVKLGVFDTPPQITPDRQIWTQSAAPWHDLPPPGDSTG